MCNDLLYVCGVLFRSFFQSKIGAVNLPAAPMSNFVLECDRILSVLRVYCIFLRFLPLKTDPFFFLEFEIKISSIFLSLSVAFPLTRHCFEQHIIGTGNDKIEVKKRKIRYR